MSDIVFAEKPGGNSTLRHSTDNAVEITDENKKGTSFKDIPFSYYVRNNS